MTKIDKLINKFLNKPKDLTYEELVQIMKFYGYVEIATGKTSGSRKKFKNKANDIIR